MKHVAPKIKVKLSKVSAIGVLHIKLRSKVVFEDAQLEHVPGKNSQK